MDPIVDILAGHGWLPRPPSADAGTRVAYPRADGSELVLERHDEGLRLWVIEPGDRRCFALAAHDLDSVLAAVVDVQDELSVTDRDGQRQPLYAFASL